MTRYSITYDRFCQLIAGMSIAGGEWLRIKEMADKLGADYVILDDEQAAELLELQGDF